MRAADETERQRREEELERRREAGTRAVLEVVDVFIHQKVTFTVRTASERTGPTPWAPVRLPGPLNPPCRPSPTPRHQAGSTVVEDVNVPALICVADLMLTSPAIKVGVEAARGIELAAERAESIVQWLVDQGGVSVSRLRTSGGSGGGGARRRRRRRLQVAHPL